MRDLSRCVVNQPMSTEGYASLSVPTHRASTIVFPNAEAYAQRSSRGPDGFTYGLHGTPTTRALEARLTALEGGERTALLPSGQAAIAIVMLTVLQPGDKVLIPDTVYPPVRGFAINYLRPRGIEHEIYDPTIGAQIGELIDARTKLVWIESPGSTTMEIQDVAAIAKAAHAKGALVGCDNTWATPLLFKPLAHGADFSMEAITKYIGGHSDLLMGSISVKDVGLHHRIKATMRMLGIGVSPDDCFLVLRGLETMGVRLRHMGQVAQAHASMIAESRAVARVLHPALATSPGHDLWKRDFAGASGVFSVVLKPGLEAELSPALSAMKVFSIGASWGGTHSLCVPMEIAKDRTLSALDPKTIVLRISIGLEDPLDLLDDLKALFGRFESVIDHR
jgi:cystathionine beta-lyase